MQGLAGPVASLALQNRLLETAKIGMDGRSTPSAMGLVGHQANGLDFLAVTDHVNGFRAMSDAAYLVQNATVLAMDDTANGFVMIPAAELWFYRGNSISDPLGHKTLLM